MLVRHVQREQLVHGHDAAALVWSKAPQIVRAFDEGSVIPTKQSITKDLLDTLGVGAAGAVMTRSASGISCVITRFPSSIISTM